MPVLIDLIAFFEDEEQKNEDHNSNRLKTLLLGTRYPFLLGFMTLIIIIIIISFLVAP